MKMPGIPGFSENTPGARAKASVAPKRRLKVVPEANASPRLAPADVRVDASVPERHRRSG